MSLQITQVNETTFLVAPKGHLSGLRLDALDDEVYKRLLALVSRMTQVRSEKTSKPKKG